MSSRRTAAPIASVGGHPNGQVPRALREEQLLDTALSVFAEQGYEATSIVDIAAAAGITRPVVYKHYGSKDGIYLACLRRARQQLEQQLAEAIDPDDDAEGQLRAGIDAYFRFVEDNGREWDVLFGNGMPVSGPAADGALELRQTTASVIGALLAQTAPGIDAQSIDAFAQGLNGSGVELARWWRRNPHLTREQVVEYHLTFAWAGLGSVVRGTTAPR
ncbi:TetR/AcrR family transcriptional regulator [Patulibacter defluvii]|uniref:TetR/AcrR family transcriptional regulator n=1 Tax=Patulibacter defluvii TaxID=3095358 RepID=UPI002A754DC7|nr:TetR/AcrR family transcriptional regulator [Patulibacter sp. DM4]